MGSAGAPGSVLSSPAVGCERAGPAEYTGSCVGAIPAPRHMRKPRLRDAHCLAQGHTAIQRWTWDWT